MPENYYLQAIDVERGQVLADLFMSLALVDEVRVLTGELGPIDRVQIDVRVQHPGRPWPTAESMVLPAKARLRIQADAGRDSMEWRCTANPDCEEPGDFDDDDLRALCLTHKGWAR